VPVRDLPRLLRTSAVRLALRYAVLYAVLAGAGLFAAQWFTARYVDAQLSAGLREDFQILVDRYNSAGTGALASLLAARAASAPDGGRYYLLVDKDGRKVAGNLREWPPVEDDTIPLDGQVHAVWLDDVAIPPEAGVEDDAYWPVIATRLPDGSRLVAARSVKEADQLQLYGQTAAWASLAVIVVLALAMGLFMGRTILRRIDAITATAGEIMAGDLSRRMPVRADGDEFDALSERLNRMLERIAQLMAGMREVTDNVAHDLRSPLTRLRNRLEVTLLHRRDEAEYRRAMEEAIRDADGLMGTFNAILQSSQAASGTVRAEMAPVDLSALVTRLGELYGPTAEDRDLGLTVDAPDGVTVTGNRDLLAQAVGNLLDNAIKYTPTGGRIRLAVERGPDGTSLAVADTGPGIPVADRGRVTERFVRLGAARGTEGNGLGLSLVDAIARQHGARLALDDNHPGLVARITFPAA
jgi:signal transduction histidine kinase